MEDEEHEDKNENPGRGRRPDATGCPICQSNSMSETDRRSLFICDDCGAQLLRSTRRSTFGEVHYFIPVKRPGLETVHGVRKNRAANVTEN